MVKNNINTAKEAGHKDQSAWSHSYEMFRIHGQIKGLGEKELECLLTGTGFFME